ncbi:acetyl-CoA acetyltransferase [candidate division LCP-89 bacterium B3_LCP]|uniref:Acetyl-CoA acetyltransferase n=1 Tax=candidate division LCP-89 bacterium B3_LCP TaxID=2012998 RepID=A0A532UYL6_UNCL8|nr:MAG: acetyl-CoA acetyltransferase [candidate division LCP-89 bacterium B3_LCP]
MNLSDIVAISACRTPMGNFGGTLRNMDAYDIGAVAVKAAVERAGITSDTVQDVILGSCRQAGNGVNPARTASVHGGIPKSVPAITLNMACPSGMRAIAMASQQIRLGDHEVVLVGGFDSMSTIPYLVKNARWSGFKMGNKVLEDGWSDSVDRVIGQGMGVTAENLVDKYNITRQEMDEFAAKSHEKAHTAWEKGLFNDEVVPITVPPASKKAEPIEFTKDETIRYPVNLEKMAKLPAAFKKDGSVTAGNSCGMSDGACALIFTTREKAKALGATPLFSLVAYNQVAVDNETMGEGPGVSIPAALENAGLTLSDMDLIEANEAFAAQMIANQKMLNWDVDKVNVNGGAIALGHPTGISGARIVVTLYHALKNRDKEIGVAGICGGGGVTMAMVIKRES